MVGDEVLEEAAARAESRARVVGAQILEQERHTPQGSLRQTGLQRGLGLVEHGNHDGVQRRVPLLEPDLRRLQQLVRRHLAPGDELGQPDGIVVLVVHGLLTPCADGMIEPGASVLFREFRSPGTD